MSDPAQILYSIPGCSPVDIYNFIFHNLTKHPSFTVFIRDFRPFLNKSASTNRNWRGKVNSWHGNVNSWLKRAQFRGSNNAHQLKLIPKHDDLTHIHNIRYFLNISLGAWVGGALPPPHTTPKCRPDFRQKWYIFIFLFLSNYGKKWKNIYTTV